MPGLLYFVRWYYTTAIVDGIYIAGNYSWNVLRVFSVREILHTLFAPYRRTTDAVPSFFLSTGAFFEAVAGNAISRVLGFVIRLIVLAISLVSFVFALAFSALMLAVWIALPLLAPYLFAQSITFLV